LKAVRVLHVSPYFAPAFVYGGPPRSILGLCRGLQAQGIDVQVITTTAAGADRELPPATREPVVYEGVSARYFPLAEPRRFWNAPGIRRMLAREIASYDVVHIHGLWHLPGWDAARFARRAGVPYVISPRGMLEPEALAIGRGRKRIALGLIEGRNLRSAACLHATSSREVETLEAANFGPRVVYAPNGIDVDPLRSTDAAPTLRRFAIDGSSPFVLFLGRVHAIKRLDLIADAMARLRTGGVRVVVAGPDDKGHRSAIAPRFAAAGVSVTWTGPVEGREKADLLSAASALVMCSDSESFGLSAAEAMAVGTPVVVTRTCPWSEAQEEGAGRWVEQNAASIAAALDEILGDRALASRMGERGRALIARRYSWPAAAAAVAEAYRSIAASRASRASRLTVAASS
jgi:glycosyltransferase involved in cell wall biosynthesis